MPSTENQGSSSPFHSLGRSIWNVRREQIHSIEGHHDPRSEELELDSFYEQIADQFNALSAVADDELMSLTWITKLLGTFVFCQEEFRDILLKNKLLVSKPPLARSASEFFERSLKALDIFNATCDGIEKIRLWQKHLDIVKCALVSQHRTIGEGQFRRARKALMDLALTMLDEKDSGSVFSHRNRSFGRHNTSKDHQHHLPGHSRSLSWSVSRSWSGAKQLQSFSNSLTPPRVNEIAATKGLAVPVFAMSSILMFLLWTLVAAIPCLDRSLNIHFSIPGQFSWGTPILFLHERIIEESKKRDRRNSNGMLNEIYLIDRCTRQLSDFLDVAQFPLPEEQKIELEHEIQELTLVCKALKNDLDALERRLREVFRKIMNMRIEGLELLGSGSE